MCLLCITFNKHSLTTHMNGKFLCFMYTCFAFFASKLVIKTNYDVLLLVAVVCELSVCVLSVTVCAKQPCFFNKVE